MNIAFVIPVYNEEATLEKLAQGITTHTAPHPHRMIFVDDGSNDGSWEKLLALRAQYDTVDLIRFRRNFGKTQALAAAFEHVNADVVITMDADLQDDPKEIPRLLEKLEEGYDLVCGWKANRLDPWHKTIPSRIFNWGVTRGLFGLKLHDVNTGFKAMRIDVIKYLPLYGEMHRMIAVYAAAWGYRVTEIPVQHHPRRHGHSKFGVERFTRGALDACTAWFLTRRGQSPAHLFGVIGLVATAIAAITMGLSLLSAGFFIAQLMQGGDLFPYAALGVTLFWATLSTIFGIWGALSIMGGILGELLVHRFGRIAPDRYITEEHLSE